MAVFIFHTRVNAATTCLKTIYAHFRRTPHARLLPPPVRVRFTAHYNIHNIILYYDDTMFRVQYIYILKNPKLIPLRPYNNAAISRPHVEDRCYDRAIISLHCMYLHA